MNRQIKEILQEELLNYSFIFKDINKIALDYVPDQILHRDQEIKLLTQYVKIIFKSFQNAESYSKSDLSSFSIFILGNPSTGKTVTIKRFGKDFENFVHNSELKINFFFKYINCIRYRTVYAIMVSLIQSFVPNFPSRGFSTLELILYFKKYLQNSNSYLLLCLDNIDSLELDKDYIIMLMSLTKDSNDIFQSNDKNFSRISLFLTSNNSNYLNNLDSTIRTYLEKNVVYFGDYTKIEVKNILKDRVKETLLENTWNDEIINAIVDRLEKNDPRLAFEVLWRATREAEKEKGIISVNHIEIAFQDILPGIGVYESIISLRYQLKVFLYIAVQLIINNKNFSEISIKEIYNKFKSFRPVFRKKIGIGYTSIYNYSQELKKMHIIDIEVTGKNKIGRSSNIKLNLVPSRILDLINKNELFKIT